LQTDPPAWRKWLIPAGLILGFVAVLWISNQPLKTPEGLPIITDMATYTNAMREATALTQKHFQDYDLGNPISDADKADLRKGAMLLDMANKLQPDKAGLYLDAGRAYLILGDIDEAEQRLLQCLSNSELKSSDLSGEGVADAYFLLAQTRALRQDWKESLKLVTEADKRRPHVATYLTAKASAEVQLKMLPQAKKDLAAALSIDPTYKRALALQRLIELASKE